MSRPLHATHGTICRLPGERFGYFGWPTVARLENGTLLVASSGLRSGHICPWGKTVLHTSSDHGQTWSASRVINDSPLDDRDAGLVDLGGGRLLVSWFTSDTRIYRTEEWVRHWLGADERQAWQERLDAMTDDVVARHLGSWIMLSADAGATWGAPIRVPVSAPHGPVRLRSGDVLYLGKRFVAGWDDMHTSMITAAVSRDGGRTWHEVGTVPPAPGTVAEHYHEPHVVELPSGRLIGAIRIEDHRGQALTGAGIPTFSIMTTVSDDGGRHWSPAQPLGFHGSPPHLLRHSSGVLVMTYGYRRAPYGQRAAFSRDDGATWEHDWIIRDDGPDGDLGYPSTVELADGSLCTAYYQQVPGDARCSLLCSCWQLPASG